MDMLVFGFPMLLVLPGLVAGGLGLYWASKQD